MDPLRRNGTALCLLAIALLAMLPSCDGDSMLSREEVIQIVIDRYGGGGSEGSVEAEITRFQGNPAHPQERDAWLVTFNGVGGNTSVWIDAETGDFLEEATAIP